MTRRVEWEPADTIPPRDAVLRLQGISPGERVPMRIHVLIEQATAIYLDVAEPRAIARDISAEEFAVVYRGEGRNSHETPLETIFPKADRLALAAATIGTRVTDKIRDLFDHRDLALGCALDSVASAAADHLGDLLGPWELSRAAERPPDWQVLVYSPGYCGWDVTGQRTLFNFLRPEAIGITLNESCLMQPLKSISGVLVGGAAEIHTFVPAFAFCKFCGDKQCRERMASVRAASDERRS
jgi:hypothetical protein